MMQTDVILMCDLSISMQGSPETALRKAVHAYVEALKAASGVATYTVKLYTFASYATFRAEYFATDLGLSSRINELTVPSQPGNGGTALRDAVGTALRAARPGVPTLISIFTDGCENRSQVFTETALRGMIESAEKTGLVTLTCAGPSGARALMQKIGVPDGNFRAWDGTAQEMAKVEADTVEALGTYTKSRAAGTTRSTSFYADASKLTSGGVKAFTKEVQPKAIEAVPKRMAGRSIADFYGGKFKQGNHYYELIKGEYLQEDKDLIIHVKDTNEYRQGSRTARLLLGLPETGKIRVHPGPHTDKFRIFVQSSSVNRKLVEGQNMLTLE